MIMLSPNHRKMQHELSGKAKFEFGELGGKVSDESMQKVQRETSSYVSRELIRKQKELIKVIKEEFQMNVSKTES